MHSPVAPPRRFGTARGRVPGVAHRSDGVLDERVLGSINVDVQVIRDEVVVVDTDGVLGDQGTVSVLLDLVGVRVGRRLHL